MVTLVIVVVGSSSSSSSSSTSSSSISISISISSIKGLPLPASTGSALAPPQQTNLTAYGRTPDTQVPVPWSLTMTFRYMSQELSSCFNLRNIKALEKGWFIRASRACTLQISCPLRCMTSLMLYTFDSVIMLIYTFARVIHERRAALVRQRAGQNFTTGMTTGYMHDMT